MGSTGYLTCGICWMCGNCYPREAACTLCGGRINLDDDRCPQCGCLIGGDARLQARERFKALKRAEAQRDFPATGAKLTPMNTPGAPMAAIKR